MKKSPQGNGGFESLGKLLLIRILLVSSLVTTVLTAISYFIDYTTEMGALSDSLRQLKKVSIPSIATNLWEMDDESIQDQIASIVKLEAVVAVEIVDESGQLVSKATSNGSEFSFLFTEHYPLIAANGEPIGEAKLTITKEFIYDRLLSRALVFFFSQGIKTLLVSIIILYIFRFYVTSHLVRIAEHFDKALYRTRDLALENRGAKSNELDIMVRSINEMAHQMIEAERQNLSQIQVHRASAFNSARLASLGEMAGGVAHEINNPIAIIDGNVKILRKMMAQGSVEGGKLAKIVSSIEKTCSRISKIVAGLKTYSRNAEADPMQPTTVRSIFEATLGLCQEKFLVNQVKVEVQEVDPDLRILCRPTEITQVLINLLNNAFDAIQGQDSKWIVLGCDRKGDKVVMYIKDSGSGIPKNIAEKIFDPFYTTKEIGKGTGLGLSISKNIIEAHGGVFELDRQSRYTCFNITLDSVPGDDGSEGSGNGGEGSVKSRKLG